MSFIIQRYGELDQMFSNTRYTSPRQHGLASAISVSEWLDLTGAKDKPEVKWKIQANHNKNTEIVTFCLSAFNKMSKTVIKNSLTQF